MRTTPPGSPFHLFGCVLLPFGAGYFLSFLYRTVNAVAGDEVARDLGLAGSDLGLLTSVYFLTFAAFQIPLGVLLDRYGPRAAVASLLCVAALGALVFALADSLSLLVLGRGLIGLGVSACLMAAFKANAQWFPVDRVALANGVVLAMGGFGALVATAPIEVALRHVDWRVLFVGLAGLTLASAAMIRVVAPRAPTGVPKESWGGAFIGAARVFTSAAFLGVAPFAALIQGSFLAYHGLWAADWLAAVDGMASGAIAGTLATATLGMIAGTLATGAFAARLARAGVPPLLVAHGIAAGYVLCQIALVLGTPASPAVAWAALAFFGMGSAIYYAALATGFSASSSGRVTTALNMLVLGTAFALQWVIGVALDLWPAGDRGGAHRGVLAAIVALEIALALTAMLAGSASPRRRSRRS